MDRKLVLTFALILFLMLIFFGFNFSGNVVNTFSRVHVINGLYVIYTEFTGSTTDFDGLSIIKNSLENISDMTLENPSYAKLVYLDRINLSSDAVEGIINLDSNVEITPGKIVIDTINLQSLIEKHSEVSFYNINNINPVPYRNGVLCPISSCTLKYYMNGLYIVDVVNFSSLEIVEGPYCGDGTCQSSSGETCNNCPSECCVAVTPPTLPLDPDPPSRGGGNFGGIKTITTVVVKYIITYKLFPYNLEKSFIKIFLKPGQSVIEYLELNNPEKVTLKVKIKPLLIEKFINESNESIILMSGESKTYPLVFHAPLGTKPDSYIGKLYISGNGVGELINVIIEVGELNSLFDVNTKIVERNSILKDNKVRANIQIMNKGDVQNLDLDLYYAVKSSDGRTIVSKTEKIAINDKLDMVRELELPKGLGIDDYIFYTRITYKDDITVGSDFFSIRRLESPMRKNYTLYLMILIPIIILIILYFIIKRFSNKDRIREGKLNLFRWRFLWIFKRKPKIDPNDYLDKTG